MTPRYAISLHAPWAWAILHAGKDVENRAKTFPRRKKGLEVTGRVWVHASMWPRGDLDDDESRAYFDLDQETHNLDCLLTEITAEKFKVRSGESFYVPHPPLHVLKRMRGHIVGSVEVYAYQPAEPYPPKSPWYVPGSLGIMLRDPLPLETPVPARGALGWWSPPEDVMAQLRAQVAT